MGYKLAGCDVLGCCEIDKRMNDVYVKNHSPKHNYLMDIRDFNNLPNDKIPEELFNLDILDGSPPCTTFSMSGDREESWGKMKKFKEGQAEQTLDDLSFVFIETVAKLKPKVVIMENVEGLLLGNAWGYVQKIYKKFADIGYKVRHELLKGEEMGIPQKRHRAFFIATRLDFNLDKIDLAFNYEPIVYAEIKDKIGVPLNQNTKVYKMLCKAIRGDKQLSDVNMRENGKQGMFNYMLLYDDLVIPTIYAHSPQYYRFDDKTGITANEIIKAQTFPSDYDFINDNLNNVAYICGMSVPPVMIKRIVNRLIESEIFNKE